MSKAYVTVSRVKEYVKNREEGMRVSEDVIAVLDKQIERMLDAAIPRAVADKRKTLKARDFEV